MGMCMHGAVLSGCLGTNLIKPVIFLTDMKKKTNFLLPPDVVPEH